MSICKYCKKPISDEQVWNPDGEGNGYHHACLCEMEFISRDRQIYDKGRADVLDKIRAEIKEWYWQADKQAIAKDPCVVDAMIDLFIRTINKYKAESEEEE